MPRGYELDKYYDAMRAVNRKIFSTQIKILSGILDKIGYRHADSYKLIISSINNYFKKLLSIKMSWFFCI